ncbi:MAG: radical SAM protein [Candidatus Hodarchaeales archaeon]
MSEGYPTIQQNVYSVPFLADTLNEIVLWFFTGSRCNLQCSHCYVESGPKANKHPNLRFETFKSRLDEAVSTYDKIDIYFTGGEPFVNSQIYMMLEESLKIGNTTILTNTTHFTESRANQLWEIQKGSKYNLIFRVSLDGPNEEVNDTIRGKNAFNKAKSGIKNLLRVGFDPIVTTMKNWPEEDTDKVKKQFKDLLIDLGIPLKKQKLKVLPQLRIGREAIRERPYSNKELFTIQCFSNYDFQNLQCSKCRMVSENGLWVCPILINEDGARMGTTLKESARPFPMTYMVCWTCRMEGMNCAND